MGYSTDFDGILKFGHEATVKELTKLKTILGEDCRQHPEWKATNLSYIDLEIAKDYSGLQWDGSEKTYDLPEKVNLVIRLMQEEYPNFTLTGQLMAQGEDISDRWVLQMDNGQAFEKKVAIKGKVCTCPNCGEDFILADTED